MDIRSVVAWLNDPWMVTAVVLAMVVFHLQVLSFVLELNFFWQLGKRLQDSCGNNAMEMETVRYNVYRFAREDKRINDRKIAIITFFTLSMIVGLPAMVLVLGMAIINLINKAWFLFGGVPPIPTIELGSGVLSLGIIAIISVFTLRMFIGLAGKIGDNRLYVNWYGNQKTGNITGYAQHLLGVKKDILKTLGDCNKMTKEERTKTEKNCAGTKLYRNLVQSILATEELSSVDAAEQKLDMLLKNITVPITPGSPEEIGDAKNEGAVKYLRFNRYGPDWDALLMASKKTEGDRPDYIKNLESFGYADPSWDLGRMMRRWMLYMFLSLGAIVYLGYHYAYQRVDPLTLVLACVILGTAAGLVGFSKRYDME